MSPRRRPNRPPIVSVHEHSKQAFRGALGGVSAVPQPTDRSTKPAKMNVVSSPKMLFYQDEYVVGQDVFIDPVTGAIDLQLTYDPIQYSEHVYWHSTYVAPPPEPEPIPVVPPTSFAWGQGASGTGTRFPASHDVMSEAGLIGTWAPEAGAMVACIMLTEATVVTAPPGWDVIRTHPYPGGEWTYTIATVSSWTPGQSGTWTFDWSGVSAPQLGEWVAQVVYFDRGGRGSLAGPGGAVEGLQWDVKAVDNDGQNSGTWATVTDSTWLYSVPNLVGANCEYSYGVYGLNSYGVDCYDYGYADTNGWMWFPSVRDPNVLYEVYDPAYYVPGMTFDYYGDVVPWQPDQYYECIGVEWGYRPGPSNSTILLGLKPL